MKKAIIFAAYLVVAVLSILAVIEGGLAIGSRITDHNRLENLIESQNLPDPDSFEGSIKIAIFGGSSAAGVNSVRGFEDILRYEFSFNYPSMEIYIANYALQGATFHRGQAEIAKAVIDKYDLLIIYAGHNEAWNYWNDTGYFRHPDLKSQKRITPSSEVVAGLRPLNLQQFLRANSRIVNISNKLHNKHVKPLIDDIFQTGKEYSRTWDAFELERSVPPDDIIAISKNFRDDLIELSHLATKYNTSIIVSSVPSDESFKPTFSSHRLGITEEDLDAFYKFYQSGVQEFDDQRYQSAIQLLLKAYQIDNQVAVLHYYLGMCHLKLGHYQDARFFFRKNVDFDGVLDRGFSSLRDMIQLTSEEHSNLIYVDIVDKFDRLLGQEVSYEDLFTDRVHPSLLGHILIADSFLEALDRTTVFDTEERPERRSFVDLYTIGQREAYYKYVLGVTGEEERFNFWRITSWHLSLAENFYHRDDSLNAAEEYLNKFNDAFGSYRSSPENKAFYLIITSIIEANRGNVEQAVILANQAVREHTDQVLDLLNGVGRPYDGEKYQERFAEKGIGFSFENLQFTTIQ